MFDRPTAKSGLAYFLNSKHGSIEETLLKSISDLLHVDLPQLTAWIEGEEISESDIANVALGLNVPKWMLKEGFEEALGFDPACKIPGNGCYVPDESPLEGYWGNIGLKAPGMEKTIWMSCSDTQAEAYYESVLNGSEDTIAMRGMGLYGYIIRPENMRSMRALPEAADHVEGDWNLSVCDPCEGMPVAFPGVIYDLIYEDMPELDFKGKVKDFFLEMCEEAGGFDVITEALTTLRVFYSDGSSEKFNVDRNDDTLQLHVSNLMSLTAGLGDLETVKAIHFHSDDCPVTIPLKHVSMIQFPVAFAEPKP